MTNRTRPAFLLFLCACVATIEDVEWQRVPSSASPAATASSLGRLFGPPVRGEPSHFAVVDRGDEALDLRLALAATAESSIDAQSYLWHEDASGSLLLERLFEAADRGVRVRLLIDGFQIEREDALDAALAEHPNVEIRVFNPTLHRAGLWKPVEIAENFHRLDHRMHNKLFLVDGVTGIFGGRNIGDEYFGLGSEFDFRDFDLFSSGSVVTDLASTFDEFWNGEWTIPLRDLGTPASAQRHSDARTALSELHVEDARLDARRALGREAWLAALARVREGMVPGRAHVMHDMARIEQPGAAGVMAHAFVASFAESAGDALLVTAYLVPGEAFVDGVREHVAAGGRARILTNSLLTTNQPLAHAYYEKRRHALLEAGCELYELRPDAWSWADHRSPGSTGRFLGLHAKSAVFGQTHAVVGSMNLDPRSMELNTEIGVLVEGRELAQAVRACLEREFSSRNAWRVNLEADGRLSWTSADGVRYSQPAPSAWSSFKSWLYGWLPIGGEV